MFVVQLFIGETINEQYIWNEINQFKERKKERKKRKKRKENE